MRGWSSGLTPHGARTLLWSGFRTSCIPCSSARRCAAAGAAKLVIHHFHHFPAFPAGRRALARAQGHSKSLENMIKTCFPMDSHRKSLGNMIGTCYPMDSHTNACFCMILPIFPRGCLFLSPWKIVKPAKRRAAALNLSDSCFVGIVERTSA